MKKVLAVLLTAMVLVASFATVTAFAADSPEGTVAYKIEVVSYSEGVQATGTYTTLADGSIKLVRGESNYKFTGWQISGVAGVDYKIVSGSLYSDELIIIPLSNVKIIETYDVAVADKDEATGDKNDSSEAPLTGNNALASVSLLTALAFVGTVATKKALAK